MALKVKLRADPFGIVEMIRDKQRSVATAAVAALREVASDAVEEGRDNIAGSGQFGPKWQKGLRRRIVGASEGGEPSLQAKAIVFHKSGLAGVFEHGATIQGHPLLWIPTEKGARKPVGKETGFGHHPRSTCSIRRQRPRPPPQTSLCRRAIRSHSKKVAHHRDRREARPAAWRAVPQALQGLEHGRQNRHRDCS
jgi:Family of unknown function (DUF6441)